MGESPKENIGLNLKLTNQMQLALASRFYGFDAGEKLLEWIDTHSKKFREIINGNPNLVEQFATNPDSALDAVETLLYQEETA